jgi:aspartate/methionine/tyrosine aminotransferase
VRRLLDRTKVALSPGSWYGPSATARIRVCYPAVPPPLLRAGLDRVAAFFSGEPG